MENIVRNVREKLWKEIDEKYRSFNRSLVPGDTVPMLGVRMPKLREIAKQIAKNDGWEYVDAVKKQEMTGDVFHEELLLHGLLIGYMKCKDDERTALLDDFVPVINNWAVCDSSCMTYKFMKKNTNYWFDYLTKYTESVREYEIRFAVVSLLDHFITEDYITRVLDILGNIKHETYYVKMAVAWAVSVCYVKFPELTLELLTGDKLDDFTHQKSIQKIRESYRVSAEEKEYLKSLKNRKNNKITFRYAVRDDIPLIYDFIKKLADYEKVPEAVTATETLLDEWLFEKQRAEVVFAVLDGKEIGFSFFYQTMPAYIGKGGIYIDDLFIDARYRGRGYGRLLLKRMAEIALERGCGRMEWCCLKWNESSMNFYRSMGAIPLDECTILRMPENRLKELTGIRPEDRG